jgi:hypothetical protein
MSSLSYAIVTPSYWMDLDRCAMLVESVERWVAPDIKHYLVIANRDLKLFRPLVTARTEIVVVEDIIPRWLFRVPGLRRFWISLKTRPVKNWILQQIVKLSVPSVVSQDVLLYADSDMFFVKPYDPRHYERGGDVPFFVEYGQRGLIESNDRWQAAASRLLGLPAERDCDTNYIGQLVCWRRLNALEALQRVEETTRRQWQRAVAPLNGFSEYILYGVFVARLMGERSGHWQDEKIRTLNYWREVRLGIPELEQLRARQESFQHSVMISAKSRTTVADIRQVFFDNAAAAPVAASL